MIRLVLLLLLEWDVLCWEGTEGAASAESVVL